MASPSARGGSGAGTCSPSGEPHQALRGPANGQPRRLTSRRGPVRRRPRPCQCRAPRRVEYPAQDGWRSASRGDGRDAGRLAGDRPGRHVRLVARWPAATPGRGRGARGPVRSRRGRVFRPTVGRVPPW